MACLANLQDRLIDIEDEVLTSLTADDRAFLRSNLQKAVQRIERFEQEHGEETKACYPASV
jgi:hypothetical protein